MKLGLVFVLWLIPATAALAQWQAVGPNAIPQQNAPPGCGKLQAFAVDLANPQVMYAGGGIGPGNSGPAAESGAFKTTDGGNTWVKIDSGLTDPMVDVLWLDQSDPNIVLAGTWYDGVFRSTNAGLSWVSQAKLGSVTAFVQARDTLFAATSTGIFASADNGTTWKITHGTSIPVRALAVSGSAMYAGMENGDILFQASSGSPWETVFTDAGHTVWSIAADPESSQVAYAIEFDSYQTPDVYITHNSGASWTVVPTSSLPGPAQVLAVDSSGTVYIPDGPLYTSTDRGATWVPSGSVVGDDRFIMCWPGVNRKIVLGSDQGLYLTTDGGNTWSGLNGHINSSLLNSVAVNGFTILTTVQDYSPIASFDSGSSWKQSWGTSPPVGENGMTRFNPGNPSYAYEYTTAGFQYSTDGGTTFHFASGPQWRFLGQNNVIAVDHLTPSTVYAVSQDGIYRSSDWGLSWSKLPWPFTNVSLVVVSPKNSQTIYVATNAPALYFTRDGGTTWTQSTLNTSGFVGFPIALDIDPTNANIVLLGMSWGPNGNGGGVRISTDGGATFTSYNTGLDSLYPGTGAGWVSTILFNPDSTSDEVALATQTGAYLATVGKPWVNITGNATPRWFTDLAWANGYLYASTYGEGVIRRPLSSLLLVPSPPLLASPSDGSVGISANPTLTWHSSSTASEYELQVSTDSSFKTVAYDTSVVADTSAIVTELSDSTRYCWRVEAGNSSGTSSWSAVWNFTTAHVAEQTTLEDDFTEDTTLNSNLWAVNGPVGKIVGVELSNPAESVIAPTISFSDTSGLAVSGVDSLFQVATIQSVNPFNPPFAVQAQCFASIGYAIPYGLAIASGDGGEGIAIVGDYAAQYEGVWDQISQGTGNLWTNFLDEVYASPELNVRYQLTISVDSSGTAELAISSGNQTLGHVSREVGAGPFYLLIYQREGWPPVAGRNQAYWQWIKLTPGSITGIAKTDDQVPLSYTLEQNYPNPFNPATTISFDLKDNSTVKIAIFNVLGQQVQTFDLGRMNAGTYSQTVDMSRFASGVYFYRLVAVGNDGERYVAMKKMMLIK